MTKKEFKGFCDALGVSCRYSGHAKNFYVSGVKLMTLQERTFNVFYHVTKKPHWKIIEEK